ncbi:MULTISPECIES: WS/DGAT/MGAT family O-acyltransferase [Mycolicibacter]|uniref:Diacylglycerol O-acyltransferase n=1 Tax=[Mycobacterium] vasticus TaxID=2875777 RepID=A0ABU5Z3Z4_9MYCO|nr:MULTISPECIES: wax ester/triacylglycerol synthase family O-acyltransferase [unclassified Mycolicibacter]MEB3062052.1 wax ester/triacylglycerol synthase family O-acyltransferase [Mycolicibacter sp. MYC101]MEB3071324.1 wax ester/triacylglycerol synthase family O-acyltransferase [Mycolicibacter sp. MYC017]
MVNRLSATDASFYRMENTTTPMYVQSLYLLRNPRGGLGYEKLLATVEQRLPQMPRYRQKIREVTLSLARPVWVDDHDFDITYHVRHLAVPSPGSDRQLHELIAQLAQQPLDRFRPLWELYLIEGLADNRVALYVKSHQSMVNGMAAPALAHVLVDRTQRPPAFDEDIWVPRREPGAVELVLDAVGDWVGAPQAQLKAVGSTVGGPVMWLGRKVSDTARAVVRGAAPSSPLNTQVSQNRLFTVARGSLEDYRTVRARYDCAINDVVLAVITGALRNWLLSRGEPVSSTRTVRAMAPLSVHPDHELDTAGQPIGAVTPFLVDLPVGEPNPVVRLSQIAYATESHPTPTGLVDARTILTVSGFAPPTLHAMGVRVATAFSGFSGRVFNLLITNAPGTQRQLYVCGAKLLETYNVPPLLPNKALAIGVTSYNGTLYYGVNADRKAMSDVGVVSALLDEALAELLEAAK